MDNKNSNEEEKKEKIVILKTRNKSLQDVDDFIFEDEGYKCSER
jgi:hypothetical protein